MQRSTTIQIHDREFRVLIPYERLCESIRCVAQQIKSDYEGRPLPLFVGVLNGSFMFMSELMKRMEMPCQMSFVKLASYSGFNSTGEVSELIGLNTSIQGRDVIVVEDIVDTGGSIEHLYATLRSYEPSSIAVATLLLKPDVYDKPIKIDYCAERIADKFVVGFGLDYDQLGRNYKDLYECVQ